MRPCYAVSSELRCEICHRWIEYQRLVNLAKQPCSMDTYEPMLTKLSLSLIACYRVGFRPHNKLVCLDLADAYGSALALDGKSIGSFRVGVVILLWL